MKTVLAVVLVLTLLILLATAGSIVKYIMTHQGLRAPRIAISELYPMLKTGDLIFYISMIPSPSATILTHGYFTHVGLVMGRGDSLVLTESTPAARLTPDIYMKYGVDIVPLLVRLKFYTGRYYVMRLCREMALEDEAALLREARQLYAAETPYPSIPKGILTVLTGCELEHRHCFQYIAHLLDTGRLTPVGSGPIAEAGPIRSVREISSLEGRALPGGLYYEPPVEILYDIDATRVPESALGPESTPEFESAPTASNSEKSDSI